MFSAFKRTQTKTLATLLLTYSGRLKIFPNIPDSLKNLHCADSPNIFKLAALTKKRVNKEKVRNPGNKLKTQERGERNAPENCKVGLRVSAVY